mgnify:FL=1
MKSRCTTPLYELLKGAEESVHTQALKRNTNDNADFQIARDGTWFYHGSPILRKSLVKLFATVLTRQSDGTFWLVTPVERAKVSVQSAPFIAITATKTGSQNQQRLTFETNVGDKIVAGPKHPIRVVLDPNTKQPAPYLLVRDGLEALIARTVFYDLVSWAEEDTLTDELIIQSNQMRFSLGSLATGENTK